MNERTDTPATIALHLAILTVSDTRTEATDTSGQWLLEATAAAGHHVAARAICTDNIYQIRARVSAWIADVAVDAILITGGTGATWFDVTPEAVRPLFDKEIPGFGELFRAVSAQEIGVSTVLSRALAGIANGTLIFCMPGSTGACRTAWEQVVCPLLDSRTRPCNFAELVPRLRPPPTP